GTGETLFQTTYHRLLKLCPAENIYVVINESYREIVKTQIDGLDDEHILGEPHPRNTAPCIAYASFKINKINPDAIIAVLPGDHLIPEEKNFIDTMRRGF